MTIRFANRNFITTGMPCIAQIPTIRIMTRGEKTPAKGDVRRGNTILQLQ